MLHSFLSSNRTALLESSAVLSGFHTDRNAEQIDSLGEISVFLDQLILTLQTEDPGHVPSAPAQAGDKHKSVETRMSSTAFSHGADLRRLGFTIEEVVRNYGGLCQAITSLAVDLEKPISADEFRTLNRCLDDGIAQAVVAFTQVETRMRESASAQRRVRDHSRLDGLATMTAHIEAALLAVAAIRSGRVGMEGATAAVLDRSLKGLQLLIADAVNASPG